MPIRSPLLAFLLGGLFLVLGVITLLAYPGPATSLESWESRQRRESLRTWGDSAQYEEGYHSSHDNDPQAALFVGGVMIIMGLGFTLPPVIKWVSESAFKEAVLEPPEEGAALGGEAVVRVRLVPGGPLRVASAELRLISEEQAHYLEERDLHTFTNTSNEDRHRTRVMEVHRWSTRLAIPQDLSAPFELEVPISIPREVPPTFRWERHQARTRLELEVVLIGRMNLLLEKELRVLPRYAAGADA
jgi:hypothetical protein